MPAADGGAAVPAIEVVIVWGLQSVLHVSHLAPPRAFHVGEAGPDIDFVIGAELLGSSRLPLVFARDGEFRVVVPCAASAEIERAGAGAGERVSIEQLEDSADVEPFPGHAGARAVLLRGGARVRICAGDLTFIVSSVAAEPFARGSSEPALQRSRWTVGSAAAHVALLGLFHLLPPSASVLSMDRLDTDSRLVKYAIEAHETPIEEVPKWLGPSGEPSGAARAPGDEGEAGAPNQPKRRRSTVVAGSPANREPTPTPQQTTPAARAAGIIGIVRAFDAAALQTPFNAQRAAGPAAIDISGAMLGTSIGSSGGDGSIGMIGTGRGGGGDAQGSIGSGELGTRGRFGNGHGDAGYGREAAGSYRRRTEHVPRIRTGTPDLLGSLSKEVIRRVINRHIQEIRFCYEQQLISRPDLQGRVAIKFVIAASGAVANAVVQQSDVGSSNVDSCIAAAVGRMDFPAPAGGGLVLVTYPFVLSQTE